LYRSCFIAATVVDAPAVTAPPIPDHHHRHHEPLLTLFSEAYVINVQYYLHLGLHANSTEKTWKTAFFGGKFDKRRIGKIALNNKSQFQVFIHICTS
jgi:hypothetical protein